MLRFIRWTTLASLSFSLLLAPPAQADEPRAALVALEEELNTLKEAQENNDLLIRKLKERVEAQTKTLEQQAATMADLRKRLQEGDAVKVQIQALEARLAELGDGAANRASAGALQLGFKADIRVRPEISNNRTDFDGDTEDSDGFWSHRVRLGAELGIEDWVRAKVLVQDARRFGEVTTTGDGVAIHEGWAELRPPWAQGFSLRAGRTELAFGRERLVGTDDFGDTGQAFDGGFLRYELPPYIQLDLFYAKIRESQGLEGDGDFFGLYVSTEGVPYCTFDAYYFGLVDEVNGIERTDQGDRDVSSKHNIHTLGLRGELLFKGLLLEGEAAFQLGTRTDPVEPAKELDHFATAYYAELSYQIPVLLLPTIGAFFATATGDDNPRDTKSIEFLQLFPTRHAFLGKMDLFAWSNIMDIGGTFELTPPRGFGVYAAFHYFRLPQTSGALPGGFGAGKTPDPTAEDIDRTALGNHVGYELDLILSWSPNDLFSMEGGYSVFLPSTVIENLGGGTDPAHWAYLQLRVQY